MGKYTGDATALLRLVGGKENISAVTHCVSRMRFVLIDDTKADVAGIEALESAKGTFTQAGQFQVIIGNDVDTFYNEFVAISGIEGVSKEAAKSAAATNQNPLQRALGVLGEIFAPIIPALICGGLILGFRNVIGEVNFFDAAGAFDLEHGTQSLADLSQFWAGTYSFLWLIGEAIFHMLPVGICWSVTRKMGTTQILGIILGLTLVSPQLLNGFSVGSTPANEIPVWDFGFAQVQMIGYQGQVIAALLAAFVLVGLERFFKRVSPEVVSMIVVPLCSLLPAVVIAHTVVGPIGWTIGNAIGNAVYAGLFSDFRVLFAAAFGLLYAPVVMTGLHHMTNAVDTQLVTLYGGTALWPMIALSNIAQGSAVLAMSVLQRANERAQQVNVPACISCYLGVTEPALFGVNLKYKFPLVCGMVGSACAAVVSVGFGVEATSIGVGGLPGILSIKPQFWLVFLGAMLVAVVVPFVLTTVVGLRRLSREQRGLPAEGETAGEGVGAADDAASASADLDVAAQPGALLAPLAGTVRPIEEMPDQTFASKLLGDGVMIEPAADASTVYAPADATVTVTMPSSNHAIGLTLDNGLELLIHVGIDTVDMQGEGFGCLVAKDERVRAGQRLLTFSQDAIEAAGHPCCTAVVVSAPGSVKDLTFETGMDARAGETVVARFEEA